MTRKSNIERLLVGIRPPSCSRTTQTTPAEAGVEKSCCDLKNIGIAALPMLAHGTQRLPQRHPRPSLPKPLQRRRPPGRLVHSDAPAPAPTTATSSADLLPCPATGICTTVSTAPDFRILDISASLPMDVGPAFAGPTHRVSRACACYDRCHPVRPSAPPTLAKKANA